MKPQNKYRKFKIKVLQNSVKFYLPRVEQYLEVVQSMASKYEDMSMIEIDGYFEGKFEPVKYVRVEIHTDEDIKDQMILRYANKIRQKLKQKSLGPKVCNELNDMQEVSNLAEILKQTFYRQYLADFSIQWDMLMSRKIPRELGDKYSSKNSLSLFSRS